MTESRTPAPLPPPAPFTSSLYSLTGAYVSTVLRDLLPLAPSGFFYHAVPAPLGYAAPGLHRVSRRVREDRVGLGASISISLGGKDLTPYDSSSLLEGVLGADTSSAGWFL